MDFGKSAEFNPDLSKSREMTADRSREMTADRSRTQLKSSTFDRSIKLTPRVRQLVEDYIKLFKENQDLVKKNAKLQNGISHYFKDHLQDSSHGKKNKHESKEESQRHAEEAETEQQRRYESGFRVVKDLNRKIAAAKEAATQSGQNIKTRAAQMEIQVQKDWKAFQDLQMQTAKDATFRNGQPIEKESLAEHLDRIAQRLAEWRTVGMKGAFIFIKRTHLEEQLRKLDNFGGDLSLNHYDELKAMGRLHQERNDDSIKELEAARIKEAHGSQVVAHLSEKVCYLKVLKKELVEKMGWLEQRVAHQREKLNRVKMDRDTARKEVSEIKAKTGIMFSPHLLHDLEKKIKIRNSLIKELVKANASFTEMLGKANHGVPVDVEAHYQNMARGNIPLLPEQIDDEESMDIICAYDGKSHNDKAHGDGHQRRPTTTGRDG
ncbi:hypothetical protein BV898_10863 [Hypsibius exemplaris]|uniref:CCDC113/CCDC96 coiled-coil domain-containing protein n=1 Tax=Hypsibius exemplaris TaxID=2072580 RepID=A0A1W0WIF6_HYPEX|nr:hypothetical protein BV898_10863 [Hypsibius exemplaris]